MTLPQPLFASHPAFGIPDTEGGSLGLDLRALKQLKNDVVGDPSAKRRVLGRRDLIHALVQLVDLPPGQHEREIDAHRRLEATLVLSSVALLPGRGAIPLLSTALVSHLLRALSLALARSIGTGRNALVLPKETDILLKALGNIAALAGGFCARGEWGGGVESDEDDTSDLEADNVPVLSEEQEREAVGRCLSFFLEPSSLSLLLSLLPSPTRNTAMIKPYLGASSTTTVRVLSLLTTLVQTPAQRVAVLKAKARRCLDGTGERAAKAGEIEVIEEADGKETPELVKSVVWILTAGRADGKTITAALTLLRALGRDDARVSREILALPLPTGTTTLGEKLQAFMTHRDGDVQLATIACLATLRNATRALNPTPTTVIHSSSGHTLADPSDPWSQTWIALLSNVSRLLGQPGEARIRATFILAYLVADDSYLQSLVLDSDVLVKLGAIISESAGNPAESASALQQQQLQQPSSSTAQTHPNTDVAMGDTAAAASTNEVDWPADPFMLPAEEDLDGKARLREGALTALASLSFLSPSLRQQTASLPSLPSALLHSLTHPRSAAVRAAACQLARALSRSVAVLRTSLVDAGVADELLARVADKTEKEEVKVGALAAVANLALDFSPMKEILVERGLLEVLAGYCLPGHSPELRLNAAWALKNVLYRSTWLLKERTLRALPFATLEDLLSSPTPDLRVGQSALKGVSAPPSILSFTTTALASLPTQALAFLRNLLADATSAEINGVFHLPSANSSRSSSGTASPTATAANAASRASAEGCWPGLTLEKFLPLVWRQLDSELGRGDEVVGQALYVLACGASGSEPFRRALLDSHEALHRIKACLDAHSTPVRTAAVVVLTNLASAPSRSLTAQAIDKLTVLGVDLRIRAILLGDDATPPSGGSGSPISPPSATLGGETLPTFAVAYLKSATQTPPATSEEDAAELTGVAMKLSELLASGGGGGGGGVGWERGR